MPIKAITPVYILEVLKGIAQDNGPSVADEAKRTMSGVFELAIATLRANSDPVHPFEKHCPQTKRSTSERSRQRKLANFARR